MGIVIDLAERRRARPDGSSCGHRRATFLFDLADPGTYLAAERVERLPARVRWLPAATGVLGPATPAGCERRARELRLPLVWPDDPGAPVPGAMRVAAHAAECGRAPAFVLAASRLAFCGGFDLDDPEILAEAAAAAGLGLRNALRAARDAGRDERMARAGRLLAARGADATPVLQVGRVLFAGEHRLAAAAAVLRGGVPGAGARGRASERRGGLVVARRMR